MKNEDVFGEPIHCYSRAQAIEDGVLVDVSATAREAGFKFPVALTQGAWAKCVEVPPGVKGQDETGRLWDVLNTLRWAIRASREAGGTAYKSDTMLFKLHVRTDNRERAPGLVTLKSVCGPSDDLTPCITVMLPEED